MKRKVVELVLILFVYLLQVTVGSVISLGGIMPDLLILLPILFGFFQGSNEGMFVGFFSGLMYDLFFSSLFGFSALVFVLVGYFNGILHQYYNEKEFKVLLATTTVSCFVFSFLSYVGYFLLQNRLHVGFYLVHIILPETVYTVLIMLLIHKPIAFLNSKLDAKSKRSVDNFD